MGSTATVRSSRSRYRIILLRSFVSSAAFLLYTPSPRKLHRSLPVKQGSLGRILWGCCVDPGVAVPCQGLGFRGLQANRRLLVQRSGSGLLQFEKALNV